MADLGFSDSQLSYAARIIGVGKGRGMSQKDILTALMVALAESEIRNLANNKLPESLAIPHDGIGGDHDSVGIFQQRTSQGWGTVKELMTPEIAAGKFYDALSKLDMRDVTPAHINAQRVQRSFDPTGTNYLARQSKAQGIMDALYEGSTMSRTSTVTENAADNPIVAATKILAWLTNPDNMQRIGIFALGAVFAAFMLYWIVRETKAGKAAVSAAKMVATKGVVK